MARTKKQALRRVTTASRRRDAANAEYRAALIDARDESGASWRELEAARRDVPIEEVGTDTASVRSVYTRAKGRRDA